MTKIALILTVYFLTLNVAYSDDYSEFEEGSKKIAKNEKIAKDARHWVIESKRLVLEIDKVLREYKELQSQGKKEVEAYIRALDSLINREKHMISLTTADCQKAGDAACQQSYVLKNRLASLLKSRSNAKESLGGL